MRGTAESHQQVPGIPGRLVRDDTDDDKVGVMCIRALLEMLAHLKELGRQIAKRVPAGDATAFIKSLDLVSVRSV